MEKKSADVVAAVAQRRRVHRQQPDAVDAEPLEVVELLDQPAEVARAVVVAVEEAADVDLVEDGRLNQSGSRSNQRSVIAHPTPISGRGSCRARASRSCGRRATSTSRSRAGRARGTPAAGRSTTGRTQTPSRGARGSRLTTAMTVLSPLRFTYANSCSFSVSRNVTLSSRCSAGFSRRDRVQRRDERQQGPVERALLHLVLLGVEVLLAPGAHRHVLAAARSRSRCRTTARASRRARAAPRTRAGRRAGGTRAGCRACSRRSSAGRPRASRAAGPCSSSSSQRVFFQVKYV